MLDNIERLGGEDPSKLRIYNKVSQVAQSKKFEEKVENLITERMNEIHEKIKPSLTYAGVVNAPPSFQKVMKVAKVKVLPEERKRKLCATNIIVHGITEEKDEKKWVEELQKDLEIEIDSQYIGRIRFKKEFKLRPVKIQLKKIEDKQTIFTNLKKLKNYKEKYEGISITDDYTSAERNAIKS